MIRRLISILTVVSVICSLFSLSFVAGAVVAGDTLYGDVNGDSVVDIKDAVCALKLAGGITVVENDAQLKRSDINFDGEVSIYDARQILRCASGIANLQPSGAFSGFDGGGVAANADSLVAYFNYCVNQAKVTTDDSHYYGVSVVGAKQNVLDGPIKAELKTSSSNVVLDGLLSMIQGELEEESTTFEILAGTEDFSLMNVEEADYVSALTGAEVFGAKAVLDSDNKLTIEIAIPDTDFEAVGDSAYAKIFNASYLLSEHDSLILKVIDTTPEETEMLREFKDCVLKAVIDTDTNRVESYSITYKAKVFVKETTIRRIAIKNLSYQKEYTINYNYVWPNK